MKVMAYIFEFNGSGRLERETKLIPRGQLMVKNEERSGGGEVNVTAPTVHSNSKSNMAFRINDRELITLARPNKTPH